MPRGKIIIASETELRLPLGAQTLIVLLSVIRSGLSVSISCCRVRFARSSSFYRVITASVVTTSPVVCVIPTVVNKMLSVSVCIYFWFLSVLYHDDIFRALISVASFYVLSHFAGQGSKAYTLTLRLFVFDKSFFLVGSRV